MKNTIQIILAIFIIPQFVMAQDWVYQPQQSQLTWTGKAAFSAYALSGTIQMETATILVEDEKIKSGNFVFDTKSIDGEIKDLIRHLKSKDFFQVKKYKTAVFELTTIKLSEEKQWIAEGNLTIKNTTKPVAFLIDQNIAEDQLTVKGKAIINRTKFGITFNSPSFFEKMKEQAIADDFELNFELVFIRK